MSGSPHSAISSSAHWAERYIGKPFVDGGRGPDVFDCWGLLRWIVANELRRPLLPTYPIPLTAKREIADAVESAIAGPEWRKLSAPLHTCAVGLSRHTKLHHVGLFLAVDGGLVLHADEPRVVAQSISALTARGWNRIEFYWHASW